MIQSFSLTCIDLYFGKITTCAIYLSFLIGARSQASFVAQPTPLSCLRGSYGHDAVTPGARKTRSPRNYNQAIPEYYTTISISFITGHKV